MNELVSLRQAAREIGVTPQTVRNLIRAGEGPRALRVGKRWLKVRRGDLEEWLQSRQIGSSKTAA